MISQRRLLRSTAVAREIMTQMRYARQLAMSERQSVTFRYDDTTKQITIINHHNNHGIPDPVVPVQPMLVRGPNSDTSGSGLP